MATRRGVLMSLLGGLAAAIAGRLSGIGDEHAIAAVIRKRLGYLRLDEDGVQAFAREFAASGSISRLRLLAVAVSGPIYTQLSFSDHDLVDDALHLGEDRITSAYLLSSDFFLNGADEIRTVRYLGSYDPVGHPCSNPFARHS